MGRPLHVTGPTVYRAKKADYLHTSQIISLFLSNDIRGFASRFSFLLLLGAESRYFLTAVLKKRNIEAVYIDDICDVILHGTTDGSKWIINEKRQIGSSHLKTALSFIGNRGLPRRKGTATFIVGVAGPIKASREYSLF